MKYVEISKWNRNKQWYEQSSLDNRFALGVSQCSWIRSIGAESTLLIRGISIHHFSISKKIQLHIHSSVYNLSKASIITTEFPRITTVPIGIRWPDVFSSYASSSTTFRNTYTNQLQSYTRRQKWRRGGERGNVHRILVTLQRPFAIRLIGQRDVCPCTKAHY